MEVFHKKKTSDRIGGSKASISKVLKLENLWKTLLDQQFLMKGVFFIVKAAGNAVKRATDNLVRAAQQAIQQEEERSLVLNRRMVGGIAQEINARYVLTVSLSYVSILNNFM